MRPLWILLAPLAGAALLAALDGESGLPARERLRGDLREAEARMAALREEIRAAEAEAHALEHDAFAIERAIREDLGLARPGEVVVRGPRDASGRIP